jgi:hypothetical protein
MLVLTSHYSLKFVTPGWAASGINVLVLVKQVGMSVAIKAIVDVHVRYKDRVALEQLRDHRQKLKRDLQLRSGGPFDVSQSIRIFDEDISVIESGLEQL